MKNLFLPILLLFVAASMSGQSIIVGPKAGLNLASWSTTFDNTSTRLAYHVGGFAHFPIKEKIGARVELLYSSIGAKNDSESSPGRIEINALSVPLLFVFQPAEAIALHGGLQPSLILSSQTVISSGSNAGSFDNKELFKSTDFAILLGGEYSVTEKVAAGLRIQIGLNDIFDDNEDEVRNQVIQIYGMYSLTGN